MADADAEARARAEDRRAELLGGAVTGELDGSEGAELDRLLADDPSAAAELEELRSVLAALPPRGSGWDTAPPPPLGDVVAAGGLAGGRDLAGGGDGAGAAAPATVAADRRRPWLLGAAAAALVVVGAGAALGLGALVDRPPSGPPGTLGAVEQVAVVDEPPGVDADLAVVSHTWGTETVLDVEGLTTGVDYRLVVLDAAGEAVASGGFVGADAVAGCRLNAPVLREDAARLEVLDADGDVVLGAELPPA